MVTCNEVTPEPDVDAALKLLEEHASQIDTAKVGKYVIMFI